MTGLRLRGLRLAYPGSARPVLDGLSLNVPAGRMTALLGPSGAGKSSILKLIAGLAQPDAGEITLGTRSLLPLPPDKRGVVMVFQDPLLFPHLTVAGNVGFGLRMRGLPAARIAAEVEAMLARVQLSGFGPRRPAELSGGQAQRVALARALVLKPELLLLDEPLSSLDPGLRAEMQALIRTLQRDLAVTTLVVTHDQAEAVTLADQIALVLDGRVAQADVPEALYRRPAALPVARFFGPTNLIPGRMERGRFLSPLGPLAIAPDQIAGAAAGDGPATLALRPEALVLGPAPQGLLATVGQATFLGTQARVTLAVNGLDLQALVTPDLARSLAPGQAVGLTLPPATLWVLPGADLASPAAGVS